MRDAIVPCIVVLLVLSSTICIGYAYVATVDTTNHIGSDYCVVYAVAGGSDVEDISLNNYVGPLESNFILTFTSNLIDYQETLLIRYSHTRGTDLILSIVFTFSGVDLDDNPVIGCYSEDDEMVGSTILSGSGVKEGTIVGIYLPINENEKSGELPLYFLISGIDNVEGISIGMTLSVTPKEAIV